VELAVSLIPLKIHDHQRTPAEFVSRLRERVANLKEQPKMRSDFIQEIRRFLPAAVVRETLENTAYWPYLINLLEEDSAKARAAAG
jgi:hypothetical protein